MRFFKAISLVSIALLLFLQNTVNTGCTKSPADNPADTTTNPPPPPPADTISYVKKIEVLTSLYPGYGIVKERTYSFYYDTQKRLTEVGVKHYSPLVNDTFTTRLSYTGSSKLPNRIIIPDINGTFLPNPPRYDTTWFYYAADGKLLKDSSNELIFSTRTPLYRTYTYPSANKEAVNWYWSTSVTQAPQLLRQDTIKLDTNGKPDSIKAVYQYYQTASGAIPGSYALAKYFTFSNVVNPLSKLNISGTPYSLIYTSVKKELLGNSYHWLVYNSNGAADYLDFISPFIPTIFYISAYSPSNQPIGSSVSFSIDITPWAVRPSYPSEISVRMSASLAGDRYIYRYTY